MFVAGMWFQDLWTYDFRRTEMCIIPYATQMGEISFCAYNTGVGWRQIVENMYQNATVADWYREHGKHAVYANPRKAVPLPDRGEPLALHIPKDGRLVDWTPRREEPAAAARDWRLLPLTVARRCSAAATYDAIIVGGGLAGSDAWRGSCAWKRLPAQCSWSRSAAIRYRKPPSKSASPRVEIGAHYFQSHSRPRATTPRATAPEVRPAIFLPARRQPAS